MLAPTVVVTGHSHLLAIRGAAEADPDAFPFKVRTLELGGRYNPIVRPEGAELVYNELMLADYTHLVRESKAKLALVSLIGAESFIWAVHGHTRPFDVVLPFAPDLPIAEGAEIIPYRLLRHSLFDALAAQLRTVGQLQAAGGIPVVQALPPPPAANREVMLQKAPAELRLIIRDTGLPPWAVQYKLWLIWNDIAAELAEADGVPVLYPPPEALDDRGLLRPDLTHDCVHGNVRYGALVLNQLEALLQPGG